VDKELAMVFTELYYHLTMRFVWFAGGTGAKAWSCLQIKRKQFGLGVLALLGSDF
jgi:hypothetical protein